MEAYNLEHPYFPPMSEFYITLKKKIEVSKEEQAGIDEDAHHPN